MLLNKYEQREKDALATSTELNELSRRSWEGRWIECEPFQHGWIRDWVLRGDVARRKDAEDFRRILKVIGTNQWAKEREFLGYSWAAWHRRRVPMDLPPLRPIDVRPDPFTGEETGWPKELPVSLKKWFYYHNVNAPFCNCYRRGQYYRPAHYVFKNPWMFELRIRPAYISRVPDVSGDMETKIARLEQHMEANQYWRLLSNMRGHSWRYSRREDLRRTITKNQLDRELAEELP